MNAINAINAYRVNHPKEIKAGLEIASALSDEFKALFGAGKNVITLIDSGRKVCNGVAQGIQHRNFVHIQNVSGDAVQAAIAGVLFVTGMFYAEIFKRVALIIGIAQGIFNINRANQPAGYSQNQELAKLGINAISLAFELTPSSSMLFAAKTTSQVAYFAFQSINNYANNDNIEAFQTAAVGLITGAKGVSKYVKLVEAEDQLAEDSKLEIESPEEEPVAQSPKEEPSEEQPIPSTPEAEKPPVETPKEAPFIQPKPIKPVEVIIQPSKPIIAVVLPTPPRPHKYFTTR